MSVGSLGNLTGTSVNLIANAQQLFMTLWNEGVVSAWEYVSTTWSRLALPGFVATGGQSLDFEISLGLPKISYLDSTSANRLRVESYQPLSAYMTTSSIIEGQEDVSVSASFQVTFDHLLHAANVIVPENVRILDQSGNQISITPTYTEATSTLSIAPTATLNSNSNYTLVVTSQVRDWLFEKLERDIQIPFKTGN